MESRQLIQSRLKAIKNVGQITKAMEVVSATKMRRAQEVAFESRPYAYRVFALLASVSQGAPVAVPLMESRPVSTTLVAVIASDRGLAGSFNAQVFRAADGFFSDDGAHVNEGHSYRIAAVGKKAVAYAAKKPYETVLKLSGFGDYAKPGEIAPLSDAMVRGFLDGSWDRVVTVSMHFRTTLKQEVLVRQILPVDVDRIRESVREIVPEHGRFAELADRDSDGSSPVRAVEYIFEPSPAEVLSTIIPHLVRMQVYHLMLEANASEHSARRVAMKNASDNAVELSDELGLMYNKARQAAITNEIIEIVSTQNALT